MRTKNRSLPRLFLAAASSVSLVISAVAAQACTGIVLTGADAGVVSARTLEFGFDVQSEVMAIPAGTEITTLAANPDLTGFTYTTTYGFVGLNALDLTVAVDGMNEKGLYFGAFFFPGEAEFGTATAENASQVISSEELGNWILGNFATVQELRAALPAMTVVGTVIEEIGGVVPLHYSVVDATGAAIVIEYSAAGLKVFDNTVHVITNSPAYDWHMTNLRNYIGLSPDNDGPVSIDGQTLAGFGQGTGMFGLPGDFTPPSRFVRATAFVATAEQPATSDAAVFQAFHLLNAFDIPKGLVRDPSEDGAQDYTVWTSAADTKAGVYYFKTYQSQQLESVTVAEVLAGLNGIHTVPMDTSLSLVDRSADFPSN
ncbi:choloylglycine hydrolase family protein [Pseudoruegeria sp. SK021]|uniref:choloylglycine hydrolase family protein n=1 Tax=Pseudoruegeria sp. SK021 TaxID=1933035 RepID=UPI000A2414FB|nr:choloylglycine hydrolase family protein [Pseudoruegeria sp. SK021]OSP56268.1 choloylglycine hydrolase [Pseudoruegeria sp. SK021]